MSDLLSTRMLNAELRPGMKDDELYMPVLFFAILSYE